jgi:aminocarboxymuconate-semialdehyde decarboxylase
VPPARIIDVHAHFVPRGLPDLAAATGDRRWPVLLVDGEHAAVSVDGVAVRRAGPSLHDVGARIRALDAAGVDRQVVSPVPVTLVDWARGEPAVRWCRALNDGLAAAVAGSRGRLLGLGAVPLGPGADTVADAVREAERVAELGLAGLELPTVAGGRELDDPQLYPLWDAVQRLGLALFVHPTDAHGAIRRTAAPYGFGIGMLADTAMAATALIFGGVLARFPGLRIALAHGCGALPWTYPRTRLTAGIGGADVAAADELLRRLWVDTLVFDPEHIRLLRHRFPVAQLMLGTDDPLVPGQLVEAQQVVREAARRGVLDDAECAGVLGGNAERFLAGHTGDRVTSRGSA